MNLELLVRESVRVLFSFGGPLVLALAVAGGCGSLVQHFLKIQDYAVTYALKLLIFIITIGALAPQMVDSLQQLLRGGA